MWFFFSNCLNRDSHHILIICYYAFSSATLRNLCLYLYSCLFKVYSFIKMQLNVLADSPISISTTCHRMSGLSIFHSFYFFIFHSFYSALYFNVCKSVVCLIEDKTCPTVLMTLCQDSCELIHIRVAFS